LLIEGEVVTDLLGLSLLVLDLGQDVVGAAQVGIGG
jgi:hypothetical protein